MSEIITAGLDLGKNVFQAHGADAAGQPVLRKKLRRGQVPAFFSGLQPCVVAIEACGGAHFWGREISKLGCDVRLIPPAYVIPFVKRQKNDAADAEATCEAALCPAMRFVPIKSEETQRAAMVFRVRELLIRQRTQAINALRGLLSEFGQVAPQGAANASKLIAIVDDPESGLPADAASTLKVLITALTKLEAEIVKLDAGIARRAKENDVARRLMTVPGIGPLIATAIATLAPPPETSRKARDFAAWLGLTPRQHSTGGKQRLGAATTLPGHCVSQCPAGQRMGERSLRRLLIIGANSVIIKRHVHAEAKPGTWLGGMLSRKPPMLVRVALANKMARIVWALIARGGVYQSPATVA
ncbi:IS110 family transposase [Leisingera sp. MMG026]|uniref:IS110 family transposase n=1 Tax=Leisingera sp. MMG026 TaxID=2909982 RepID=UPI001F027C6D|nr:IS110 family transposase [Leisingera sp. MMG026]MCF6432561.1 IS110 family transposase [Leisingera sp. MMG026]